MSPQRGDAEFRDRAQQVQRADAVPDGTGGDGGVEQVLQDRAECGLEVLPVAQRYGMGTVVWSPLAQGLLTGRVRKGQPSGLRRGGVFHDHLRDERRIDAVEQLIPLADEAGLSLTHLAMAFAIAHPGVTAAILGPRTRDQLDDLLAGAAVVLSDEILDRIDEIVPPGSDVGRLDMAYHPPAVITPALRRRPAGERTAA
jgi:aryl-alcohol dehydrogenase-like predicted oxidoreductase